MILLLWIMISLCKPNIIDTFETNEEWFFIDQEKIVYSYNSYFVPFNDQEELGNIIKNKQYFELMNLVQAFQLSEISNTSRVRIFHDKNEEKVNVCIQNKNKIACKLQIDSIFINDNLQLNQIDFLLSLPNDDCEQIYHLKISYYLMLCKTHSKKSQLILMNGDGELLDCLEINSPDFCKQQISILDNTILIYNTKCNDHQIQLLQLNEENNSFKQLDQVNLDQFSDLELGKLFQAQLCQNNEIFLNFEKSAIVYSIKSPKYSHIFHYDQNVLINHENCKTEFVLGLDELFNQFNEIIKQQPSLVPDDIKKFTFVDQNFIFQTKNDLIIHHNHDINYKLVNVIDFQIVLKIPFIIIIFNNQTLLVYQINQQSKIVPFSHTKYLGIFHNKTKISLQNNEMHIISTNEIDFNNQSSLINIEKNKSEQFIEENQAIPIQDIRHYFPFSLVNYNSHDANIHLKYSIPSVCDIDFNNTIKYIKAMAGNGNCFSILFQIQGQANYQINQNYLQSCCDSSIIKLKFIISSFTNEQIYYFHSLIIKQAQFSVQCFIISNKFDVVHKQIIEFESEILNIYDKNKNIFLVLKNGKQYSLIYDGLEIFLVYESNKNNLLKKMISIQNNCEIKLNKINSEYFDQILKLNGQIIGYYDYVTSNRFLVVCLQENDNVIINLYFYSDNTIIFLYQIPLYKFIIILPLMISYHDKFFGVLVKKEKFEGCFLLFYKVNSQMAISSLYSIIRIDNLSNINYFNFEKVNQIVYCGKSNCILQWVNQDLLQFNQQKTNDQLQIKNTITFTIYSYILEQQFELNRIFYYFNQNQNLRFKLNVKNNMQILHINDKQEVLGFENIFGEIENITIPHSCDGTLIQPIEFIQHATYTCNFIYQKFCFQTGRIIFDPFRLHIIIHLNVDIQINQLNLVLEDGDKLKIFYLNQYNELMLTLIDNWRENNSQETKYLFTKLKAKLINEQLVLYYIKNALYIEHNIPYIIILNSSSEKIAEKEFISDRQSKVIYFENISDDQFKLIRIVLTNTKCLTIDQHLFQKENNDIKQQQHTTLRISFNIEKFLLLKVLQTDNFLQIEIIIEPQQPQAAQLKLIIYYSMIFDLKNNILVNEQIQHYFRFKNGDIKSLYHFGKSLIIVSLLNNVNNKLWFYNLNLINKNQQFSDFYFAKDVNEKLLIQKYNDSHQIIFNQSQTLSIYLVDVQSYKLTQTEECIIQLNNQVSTLQVIIKKQQSEKNPLTLTICLGLNFIFIIFTIFSKKKKKIINKAL